MGIDEESHLEYLREQLSEIFSERFEQKTGRALSETALLEWMLANLGDRLTALGVGMMGEGWRLSAHDQKLLELSGAWLSNRLKTLKADRSQRLHQTQEVERVWRHPPRSLKKLQSMDPADFEYWVAGYFSNRGFKNVVVTQLTGDFGIDIYMICPNRLPAVVQVKRYHGSVGRPVIQQTYGAMHLVRARRCYVVTSGRFAETARALEKDHKDIVLLDGAQLMKGTIG